LNAGSKVSFCTYASDVISYKFFYSSQGLSLGSCAEVAHKGSTCSVGWSLGRILSCTVWTLFGKDWFWLWKGFHKSSKTFYPKVVFFSHTEALQQTIERNVTVKSRLQECIKVLAGIVDSILSGVIVVASSGTV